MIPVELKNSSLMCRYDSKIIVAILFINVVVRTKWHFSISKTSFVKMMLPPMISH